MTKHRFTSAALSELREAALYYEQEETGLGARFLDEIDAAMDRIQAFPARLASDVCADEALSNSPFSIWASLSNST